MRRNSFIQGALILTVAGIIVKFIGAFSRIYLSRLLGGEGIGLYQMAYPIYLLCLSVSSAGLPVAISIMVAERNAVNDYRGGQKVFHISMVALTITGVFFSALLFFGAHWLVDSGLVRDPRAYWSLLALSPAILCATLLATLRGYFQGLQLMTPTGVSQIVEQIVRVVTMIALAVFMMQYGLEYGAAGATFGAAPGAVFGILVLIVFFFLTRSWRKELAAQQDPGIPPQSASHIIKKLLYLAIPVSLANIMLPITSNIDLFIVPKRLEVAGFSVEEATTFFGYLTGMATSLVNMPTIVTASLAASLVPAISEAVAKNNRDVIFKRTDTAMRLANILTIPSFIGMCVIATPISAMLYAIPDAGPCIAVMSFGVFLLGVQQVTTGVLQGMGKTAIPFINMVISALVKIVLSWNLTSIPSLGILGAAWATNADFGVAAVLNLYFLWKHEKYMMDIVHTIKLFIAAGCMGAAVLGVYQFTIQWTHSNTLTTLIAIIAGSTIYGVAIILLRCVRPEDVRSIPKIGGALERAVIRFGIKK
ncbi:MAG: polysaccharide biosynthesis protein [Dialister sp.]|nr:polysaccharide biosynthesis protein [Dialister sp.]